MISEKNFLKYQLEVERRFHEMDKKIMELKHELEKKELREEIKSPAPIVVSDEEKELAQKEAQKQARTFAEWSEDSETLAKLGLKDSNE